VIPSIIIITILVPSLILLYSISSIEYSDRSLNVTGNQWYWDFFDTNNVDLKLVNMAIPCTFYDWDLQWACLIGDLPPIFFKSFKNFEIFYPFFIFSDLYVHIEFMDMANSQEFSDVDQEIIICDLINNKSFDIFLEVDYKELINKSFDLIVTEGSAIVEEGDVKELVLEYCHELNNVKYSFKFFEVDISMSFGELENFIKSLHKMVEIKCFLNEFADAF